MSVFLIWIFISCSLFSEFQSSEDIHSPAHDTRRTCEVREDRISRLDFAKQLIEDEIRSYPDCVCRQWPIDCEDVLRSGRNSSGIYHVLPRSRIVTRPFQVYCDMDTDGGGWTVIQRRGDFHHPDDYFFQEWEDYKRGFGHIDQDFWLGNDKIFALSNQRQYSARFDLEDFEGNRRFARYNSFWIDDEHNLYTLHIKGYSGDAGDSMENSHDGEKFSTKDRDNDQSGGNCAERYKGAWWYKQCHRANLNGLYLRGNHSSFADGVNWYSWKGYHYSLESTEIKIRSKDFKPSK